VARHGLPAVLLLTMLVIAVSLCSARLHANIDWVQAYSFMLLTLVHTPCLSTIATLRSESASNRYAIVSVTWGLVLAWGVSLAFYQTMRALGY
jgi:ferrous iron transport protein B